jgi:hypothetical protein
MKKSRLLASASTVINNPAGWDTTPLARETERLNSIRTGQKRQLAALEGEDGRGYY